MYDKEKELRVYRAKNFRFNLKQYHFVILERLKALPRADVVEIGIGDGSFLRKVQDLGYNCMGVDFLDENLKIARKKGLKVLNADLNRKLPFKNESFEYVIALEVLEHVFKLENALSEIARILKKDGRAFISVPNCAYWRYSLKLLLSGEMPPEFTGEEGHVWHYSLSQWVKILERYFKIKILIAEGGLSGFFSKFFPNRFQRYAIFECYKRK